MNDVGSTDHVYPDMVQNLSIRIYPSPDKLSTGDLNYQTVVKKQVITTTERKDAPCILGLFGLHMISSQTL